jgi:hypothetical protein
MTRQAAAQKCRSVPVLNVLTRTSRVRLRGRTVTVWDDYERHAVAIAQEWLDYSERLGIDPLATATVE